MKKTILIILSLVAVAALAAALGIPFLTRSQAAADTPTVQPGVPAAPAAGTGRTIVAEARVVPVHHAALSMAAGGIVAEAPVQEGDTVEGGQLLVRLHSEQQAAALAAPSWPKPGWYPCSMRR